MTEYVILYNDGYFNFGPEDTLVNGFPCTLIDASVYSSFEKAEEKLKDLLGAKIITRKEALDKYVKY